MFIAAARAMKYPLAGIARVVNRDHTTILYHQARITPAELLIALRFLDEPNFKANIKD